LIHGVVLFSAFFILWFLALFCVLPIGLGGAPDGEPLARPPPSLITKVLIATAIAAVLWLVLYAMLRLGVFNV
jgi:predicted secreted protein